MHININCKACTIVVINLILSNMLLAEPESVLHCLRVMLSHTVTWYISICFSPQEKDKVGHILLITTISYCVITWTLDKYFRTGLTKNGMLHIQKCDQLRAKPVLHRNRFSYATCNLLYA